MADNNKPEKKRIVINVNGIGIAIFGYFLYRAVREYIQCRRTEDYLE